MTSGVVPQEDRGRAANHHLGNYCGSVCWMHDHLCHGLPKIYLLEKVRKCLNTTIWSKKDAPEDVGFAHEVVLVGMTACTDKCAKIRPGYTMHVLECVKHTHTHTFKQTWSTWLWRCITSATWRWRWVTTANYSTCKSNKTQWVQACTSCLRSGCLVFVSETEVVWFIACMAHPLPIPSLDQTAYKSENNLWYLYAWSHKSSSYVNIYIYMRRYQDLKTLMAGTLIDELLRISSEVWLLNDPCPCKCVHALALCTFAPPPPPPPPGPLYLLSPYCFCSKWVLSFSCVPVQVCDMCTYMEHVTGMNAYEAAYGR